MLDGIILPLVTPFTEDGDVDNVALIELLDYAIEAGVHGLFMFGSQGQGPAMGHSERRAAADAVLSHVAGQVPVAVHVGTTDLGSTASLAVAAERSGAEAVAIIPPYYYSDHLPSEIDAHLIGAMSAVDIPAVIYNNPPYTGVNIDPGWLARLASQSPNLRGVKLSFASPDVCLSYVRELPERVSVYSGSVTGLLPSAPYGVRGAINPPSVLFPRLAVSVWDSIQARDWEHCIALQGVLYELTAGILNLVRVYGRQIYAEGLRMRGVNISKFPRWASGIEISNAGRGELDRLLSLECAN